MAGDFARVSIAVWCGPCVQRQLESEDTSRWQTSQNSTPSTDSRPMVAHGTVLRARGLRLWESVPVAVASSIVPRAQLWA